MGFIHHLNPHTMTDLSEVSTEKLLCEMQRRLDCQSKPEKRIVLLGAHILPIARIRRSS
jgi:hypothetical protein